MREIIVRLMGVGLTASELRDLFVRLDHRVYGGGYGEPVGWMLIASHPGEATAETDFAQVCWDGEPAEAVAIESANE